MFDIAVDTPMISSLDYIETAVYDHCRALYDAGYQKTEPKE